MRGNSLKPRSHSHTGLLVDGTSFHSHKLPFQTKAGCRLSGIPLQVFFRRCNLRTRKLAQDAYASCTCTSSSCRNTLQSLVCTPFSRCLVGVICFPWLTVYAGERNLSTPSCIKMHISAFCIYPISLIGLMVAKFLVLWYDCVTIRKGDRT